MQKTIDEYVGLPIELATLKTWENKWAYVSQLTFGRARINAGTHDDPSFIREVY